MEITRHKDTSVLINNYIRPVAFHRNRKPIHNEKRRCTRAPISVWLMGMSIPASPRHRQTGPWRLGRLLLKGADITAQRRVPGRYFGTSVMGVKADSSPSCGIRCQFRVQTTPN
jgi:hypothetical protein